MPPEKLSALIEEASVNPLILPQQATDCSEPKSYIVLLPNGQHKNIEQKKKEVKAINIEDKDVIPPPPSRHSFFDPHVDTF